MEAGIGKAARNTIEEQTQAIGSYIHDAEGLVSSINYELYGGGDAGESVERIPPNCHVGRLNEIESHLQELCQDLRRIKDQLATEKVSPGKSVNKQVRSAL